MDRVRAQFCMAVPPASTWSRARHTGTGQWPLRSRSKPMGLFEATVNDYDRIEHSNKVVEFSWWLAAVALTTRPKPVKIALFFSEDFGGDQQAGRTSIWALEGFRSLQGVGEARRRAAFFCRFAGAEQRRPMGVLTNVAALDQFLYFGWPDFQMQQGRLAYQCPLPRSVPLLTRLFWQHIFRALSPVSGHVALRNGSVVFSTSPSTGSSLLQSCSSSSVRSFPESLGRSCVDKKLTRSLLRDFAVTEGIDNFVGWDTSQLAALDSRSPITMVCSTWPTSLEVT